MPATLHNHGATWGSGSWYRSARYTHLIVLYARSGQSRDPRWSGSPPEQPGCCRPCTALAFKEWVSEICAPHQLLVKPWSSSGSCGHAWPSSLSQEAGLSDELRMGMEHSSSPDHPAPPPLYPLFLHPS